MRSGRPTRAGTLAGMPDHPDFEKIARDVLPFCLGVKHAADVPEACGLIAEQLRVVWNARGAADLAALEPLLGVNLDDETRVIRRLDR